MVSMVGVSVYLLAAYIRKNSFGISGAFSINARIMPKFSASSFAAATSSKVKPMPRTNDPTKARPELAASVSGAEI